jgi:hypothetical protein
MRRSLAAAVVLVVSLAVPSALAGPAPAPFVPAFIAGKWNGTWTNVTFGSTGPAFIRARAIGKRNTAKLNFLADFGGNVFGCSDPPSEGKTITKGKGVNHWNALGFKLAAKSKAFGNLTLTYSNATKKLTGSGGKPACNPSLTWKVSGKFTQKTFAGTVNITLPDGSKAVSKISLKRS